MNAEERETTICACDADATVHIWSAQRRYITRMRKDPAFTEVASGVFEGTEWAEFSVPADRWSPAGVKRTRSLSDEQKAVNVERLRANRRLIPARPSGAESPEWKGEEVGYAAMHIRVRKARGRAAEYPCVDCEGQAVEWSYDHTDPNERVESRGKGQAEVAFSTDPDRYQPRCKPCHTSFDNKPRKMSENQKEQARSRLSTHNRGEAS